MQNFAYDNNVKSEPYSLATDDKALKYKRTAIQDTNTKIINSTMNYSTFEREKEVVQCVKSKT